MMDEPTITINGHKLTVAQSMTVRVAIGSFYRNMPDECFSETFDLYAKRIREIQGMMQKDGE